MQVCEAEASTSSVRSEAETLVRQVEATWRARADKLLRQKEAQLREEMDGLQQEWNKERKVRELRQGAGSGGR